MQITVFTPTYNRASLLSRLYDSLVLNHSSDFEWLIVDDGSQDDTESVVNTFIAEDKLNIRYIKQLNGGKHRAINHGVAEARGELFFIVDSDDYLSDNALERVAYYYSQIKRQFFCWRIWSSIYENGKRIGGDATFTVLDTNYIDLSFKYHIRW
jgi:glycosyltransferase involved in cell wall biosynthesis